jgi:hypothetical protein
MIKIGKLYSWEPTLLYGVVAVGRLGAAYPSFYFYFGDRHNIYGPDCFSIREHEYICVLECIANKDRSMTLDIKALSQYGDIGWSRINEKTLKAWKRISE